MNRFLGVLPLLVVIFILGCEDQVLKNAVLAGLKDPDSAKFGQISSASEEYACVTVNARNSMGGYTGDQQAILGNYEGQWVLITIEEISHSSCLSMFVF